MSDSGAVDAALFAALAADPSLSALCPDGIFRDNAPQGNTRIVIVTQAAHSETPMYQGTAFETFTYAVSAVIKDTISADAEAASDRIKAVLENLTAIDGYELTIAHRKDGRIAYNEPDPSNADMFWQHFGGMFEVIVTPT